MKKIVSLALIALAMLFNSCDKADEILKNAGLSNEEVAAALKEALNVGTDTSVKVLSKLDGYYKDQAVKILLPPEAQPIFNNIKKVPGGDQLLEEAIMTINRAAEDAATTATPIFKDAIVGITFDDAMNILKGHDTAATLYLKGKTYNPLFDAFKPKIEASLGKPLVFNTSAEDAYADLIDAYNTASFNGILFPMIKENTLSEFTTNRALTGLFLKVGVEELKIRNDISHRVSDLLNKVFAEQ